MIRSLVIITNSWAEPIFGGTGDTPLIEVKIVVMAFFPLKSRIFTSTKTYRKPPNSVHDYQSSTRPKSYRKYTKDQLEAACNAVSHEGISLRHASVSPSQRCKTIFREKCCKEGRVGNGI